MPYNRFRKSQRTHVEVQAARLSAARRFLARLSPSAPRDQSESDIRMDVVRLAREKIAMGIYDNPAVWERALDRLCEEHFN